MRGESACGRFRWLSSTLIGLVVWTLGGADPAVGLVCHLAEQKQIVSTEALTGRPVNVLFIKAAKSDVKASPFVGVVLPDSGFDRAEPDLVYWFSFVFHKYPLKQPFC